ncbi:MAG: glycoside hydrolase family 26 protein [Fibrobacterales bacterium]
MTSKFSPPAGKTLMILGQDVESIAGYKEHVSKDIGGITTYTNISEEDRAPMLSGLHSTVNYGAGDVNALLCLDENPNAALVIGLFLVDKSGTNLEHIADGTLDSKILELANFMKSTERPVFLRIGYECDGYWNHYEPEQYILAFRRVVDICRSVTDNFVSVWQGATYHLNTYRDLPVKAWYPGDEYVDWCGTSYFTFLEKAHEEMLDLAYRHNKPVIICESAPQGYDLANKNWGFPERKSTIIDKTSEQIWDEWFRPYFNYIHKNSNVIRAVAYINCHWDIQPDSAYPYDQGYWGDTRIEANSYIKQKWLEEIGNSSWLHGSPDLFNILAEAQ